MTDEHGLPRVGYAVCDEISGGKVLEIDGLAIDSDVVDVITDIGTLRFHHDQDCCEHVALADFESDDDLTGATVLRVLEMEHVGGYNADTTTGESSTWTFYRVETTKGDIWMRWLGESNGYYSENVNIDYLGAADGTSSRRAVLKEGVVRYDAYEKNKSIRGYMTDAVPLITANRLLGEKS